MRMHIEYTSDDPTVLYTILYKILNITVVVLAVYRTRVTTFVLGGSLVMVYS